MKRALGYAMVLLAASAAAIQCARARGGALAARVLLHAEGRAISASMCAT